MKVDDINKYIDKFTLLSDQEPPEDKKITVFCDNGCDDVGFAVNQLWKNLGINMLIAKKWILHKDLKSLMNAK